MEQKYSIGIVGLGVMGRSLAMNMERNGFPVIGFDHHAYRKISMSRLPSRSKS
jgi:6-phosphogluconate dehydrogenase